MKQKTEDLLLSLGFKFIDFQKLLRPGCFSGYKLADYDANLAEKFISVNGYHPAVIIDGSEIIRGYSICSCSKRSPGNHVLCLDCSTILDAERLRRELPALYDYMNYSKEYKLANYPVDMLKNGSVLYYSGASTQATRVFTADHFAYSANSSSDRIPNIALAALNSSMHEATPRLGNSPSRNSIASLEVQELSAKSQAPQRNPATWTIVDNQYTAETATPKPQTINTKPRISTANIPSLSTSAICPICGRVMTDDEDKTSKCQITLDHIFPKCKGGDKCPENIQYVCRRCNQLKGSAAPSAAMYTLIKLVRDREDQLQQCQSEIESLESKNAKLADAQAETIIALTRELEKNHTARQKKQRQESKEVQGQCCIEELHHYEDSQTPSKAGSCQLQLLEYNHQPRTSRRQKQLSLYN